MSNAMLWQRSSLSRQLLLKTKQHRMINSSAKDAAIQMSSRYKDEILLQSQIFDPRQVQKLSLMLNRPHLQPNAPVVANPPEKGTPIPPGYHLVYLTPASVEADLGVDGTDKTFNPPEPFLRRMWAGGSMQWNAGNPLRVGDHVEERTRLISAVPKRSRNGHEMVLVEVEKQFSNDKGSALIDRRSWIFQPENATPSRTGNATPSGSLKPVPFRSEVRDIRTEDGSINERRICWSPAALFRFSALTYNGHMIHYSDPWCRDVEGFPAPVVHGPLNLINMLDFWRDKHSQMGRMPTSITYRALAPLYAGSSYSIKCRETSEIEGEKNKSEILITSGQDTINMRGDIVFQ